MNYWQLRFGRPFPYGQSWLDEETANFALYSKVATEVTLHFFSRADFATPVFSFSFDAWRNRTERVWHCAIPRSSFGEAEFYAYQIDGPGDPGNRFDPEKLLLDPWATAIHFPRGYSRSAASRPGSTFGKAPLGVLHLEAHPEFDWSGDRRPHHSSELVIYEMHVRGFTRSPTSGVEPARRGTYGGVIEKIPHLAELGVTAVELMPVQQYDPQEGNYWGYMTLNFFAPQQGYSAAPEECCHEEEFKAMVKAFHEAGIEVLLDVVYNHTSEGGAAGPTYCYRGIDNSSYYLLTPDLSGYRDDAGTGNVLRTANDHTLKMIMDSLRYWVQEMRVDGFRFDLASIFTRNDDGSVNLEDPPIVSEITNDPVLAPARLIGEPWDVAAYQLGQDFPGMSWMQWNGQYRDDLRRFVKSDNGTVASLMRRLYGSDDLFPEPLPDSHHPYQSVNFITAHDGFCLYDLVSYHQKRNQANGHGNTDGTDANHSWNCGWEGDEGVPAEVMALRKRQIRNFCALLMLSNGTPMIVMGDEFANTQGGNNNPYNQDNETTWLDWSRLETHQDLFRFFKMMIAFRKAHPSVGRGTFWREDVRWYGVGAATDLSFTSHTLAYSLAGGSQGDADLYVMINAYWEPLEFTVQEGPAGRWKRVVDTFRPSPDDIVEESQAAALTSLQYTVGPRSVVVLVSG